DAIAARERLQALQEATGRKYSLLGAACEFAENITKLHAHNRSMGEAVDGFLATNARVKRKNLLEAVDDFIAERKRKTEAEDGKRPKLSPEHHYNTSLVLLEFGNSFPGYSVCDLKAQQSKFSAFFRL